MESRKFKLGDKVEIHVGHNKGRQGHVIGITRQESGSDIIEVRLDPETLRSARVTPYELRHAQ